MKWDPKRNVCSPKATEMLLAVTRDISADVLLNRVEWHDWTAFMNSAVKVPQVAGTRTSLDPGYTLRRTHRTCSYCRVQAAGAETVCLRCGAGEWE